MNQASTTSATGDVHELIYLSGTSHYTFGSHSDFSERGLEVSIIDQNPDFAPRIVCSSIEGYITDRGYCSSFGGHLYNL